MYLFLTLLLLNMLATMYACYYCICAPSPRCRLTWLNLHGEVSSTRMSTSKCTHINLDDVWMWMRNVEEVVGRWCVWM